MSVRRCSSCSHSWVQHQDDDQGCWHMDCIDSPGRCQEFVPETEEDKRRTARAADFERGPRRRPTQREKNIVAEISKLQIGSMKYDVYRAILFANEHGATDEELEQILMKKHQSVSAARNSLMNSGLVVDSGKRRRTTSGVDSIVWRIIDNS